MGALQEHEPLLEDCDDEQQGPSHRAMGGSGAKRPTLGAHATPARPASAKRPFVALSGMHRVDIRKFSTMLHLLGINHFGGLESHMWVFNPHSFQLQGLIDPLMKLR